MRHVMLLQGEQLPPDVLLKEAVHAAAFGPEAPFGQSHTCPPEYAQFVDRRMLLEYQARHYTATNMVLVGAGVEHGEFLRLAEKYFGDLPRGGGGTSASSFSGSFLSSSAPLPPLFASASPSPSSSSSAAASRATGPYVGGQARVPCQLLVKDEFAHVAIAWMSRWSEKPEDRVPICVSGAPDLPVISCNLAVLRGSIFLVGTHLV